MWDSHCGRWVLQFCVVVARAFWQYKITVVSYWCWTIPREIGHVEVMDCWTTLAPEEYWKGRNISSCTWYFYLWQNLLAERLHRLRKYQWQKHLICFWNQHVILHTKEDMKRAALLVWAIWVREWCSWSRNERLFWGKFKTELYRMRFSHKSSARWPWEVWKHWITWMNLFLEDLICKWNGRTEVTLKGGCQRWS